MTNNSWIARQNQTPEARREYERERLVAWVFERIAEAMDSAGKTKADLARALGTSRGYITQLLNGHPNVTLKTLSDMAWACDSRMTVNIEPLRDGEFIATPACVVRQFRPVVIQSEEPASESEDSGELALDRLVA